MSTTRGERNRRDIPHTPLQRAGDTSLLLSERERLDEILPQPIHTHTQPHTARQIDQGFRDGGTIGTEGEIPLTSVILSTH
jgi:hypothetical protein